MTDDSTYAEFPLLDAVDSEILMHRDAHFAGDFPTMLEYYHHDGAGIMPDFEISRIEHLMHMEKELGENLARKYLSPAAIEAVKASKKLYIELRDVYENNKETTISVLMSDLILTEDEHPEKEISAIVAFGENAVDPLISLIAASTFYDPLNPGYGRAPIFAADCLGKLRSQKAIKPLFESLSYDNFYTDEAMISALIAIGQPAKEFLLSILSGRLTNKDTELAAMALASFPIEDEIARLALNKLEDMRIEEKETTASYLICACEGLKREEDRDRFFALTKKPNLPTPIINEVRFISSTWK